MSHTEVGEGFVLTNPIPEPHEPVSVGEFLAAGREHAGLSVAEVATRLRMSVKQIEALESADYSKLPEGTFLRGFVRNYAKAVSVNVDEALRVLEKTHTNALAVNATAVVAPTIAAEPVAYQPRGEALATPKSRALIALLLIACLTAVVWYWWEFVRPHRADGGRPRDIPVVVQPEVTAAAPAAAAATDASSQATDAKALPEAAPAIGPVVAPEPKPGQTATPTAAAPVASSSIPSITSNPSNPISTPIPSTLGQSPATSASAPTAALPTKAASASPTPATNTPAPKVAAAAPEKTDATAGDATRPKRAAEAGSNAVLGFTFSGESWVEVVDGTGRTVISRRYKAGDADEVSGRGPFSIVVGNAQSTRMAFNGREFDLKPHTRATVARVTVK